MCLNNLFLHHPHGGFHLFKIFKWKKQNNLKLFLQENENKEKVHMHVMEAPCRQDSKWTNLWHVWHASYDFTDQSQWGQACGLWTNFDEEEL